MDNMIISKELLFGNEFDVLMSQTNATQLTLTITQEMVNNYKKIIVSLTDGGAGTPNPALSKTGTITELLKTTQRTTASYAGAKGGVCLGVYSNFGVGSTIKGTGSLRISFIAIGIKY